MTTRTILCSLDPAKYGWTACGGVTSILEPHEAARRNDAKDRFLKQQKELEAAKRAAPYVSAALNNNNDDDTEICLPNNDTSQYYTITDPSSSSEEPKPAAAAAAASGDGKEEADNTTAIATATLGKGKEKKPLKQIAIHATTTTIKPSSSSKPNDGNNNNDTNSDNNNNDDTNTKLDIFTYHRGRCGQEPRDPSTGELLCDTDPIDTNYKWQPPKSLVCKVTVKFPLGDPNEDEYVDSDLDDDDDNVKEGNGGKGKKGEGLSSSSSRELAALGKYDGSDSAFSSGVGGRVSRSRASRGGSSLGGSIHAESSQQQQKQPSALATAAASLLPHFVEVVHWDLANPKTPSPEEYAANIASEWGLSFPQTMDLKESIERQLDAFCSAQPPFYAPIAVYDPYGSERPNAHFGPPELHCGPVLNYMGGGGSGGGGGPRPSVIRRSGSSMSGASSRRSTGGSSNRPAGAVKPDRRGIHIVPKDQIEKPNAKGDIYSDEILKRIKKRSVATVAECVARNEATLEIVKNEVCHICHNRKESGITFHCGRHSYCDYHTATRLSFRVKDYDKKNPTCLPINYCPVCTLNCTCAKCIRRLEDVSRKMKSECESQNVGVEEVEMDNLYDLCSAKNLRAGLLSPTEPRKAAPSSGNTKKKKKGSSKRKFEAEGDDYLETKRGRSFDEDGYIPRLSTSRSRSDAMLEELPKKKRKLEIVAPKPVLKVPPAEFPKEMFNGKDLDPSTPDDLNQVFTPDGFFPADDDAAAAVLKQKYQDRIFPEVLDGNFFACAVCGMEVVERICCKKCPRAYHKECFDKMYASEADASEQTDGGDAEGPQKRACKRCDGDLKISPEEDVDTGFAASEPNEDKDKIENAYSKYRDGNSSYTFMSLILYELLQILAKLKSYDYGFIFANPVNPDELTDYFQTIRKPMDYGTIMSKLEKGGYFPSYQSSEDDADSAKLPAMDAMEEIVLYALMDIRQVHHNCSLYNSKDSMYYRAGEVQARKWNAYYEKHFADKIPACILKRLANFERSCEQESQTLYRSKSFQGSNPNAVRGRPIAVFDPDTQRIVKQYLTKASAKTAILQLYETGYACEWELTNSNTKTKMEHAEKPDKTIFGYQWISIDKLKSGDFLARKPDAFSNPNPENIVIVREDSSVPSRVHQGFESEESAFEDWLREKAGSFTTLEQGEGREEDSGGEGLSDFVKNYVDGDKSINGISWNRVPTEKKNALPESSKSPGKVTLLEEESALGKREEN